MASFRQYKRGNDVACQIATVAKSKRFIGALWSFVSTPVNGRNRKVDFLVVGAQKAGTTALDAYLREHPELCLPEGKKELHFFDSETMMRRPRWYKEYVYHRNFRHCHSCQKMGEVTPCYLFREEYLRRIHKYNPDVKLMISLRDPVSRAYSQWNMQRQRGWEKRDFITAIKEDGSCLDVDKRFAYVQRGFYSRQIRSVLKYFPREQVLYILQDDLLHDPQKVLDDVASYLNVSFFQGASARKVHQRSYENPLDKKVERHLRDKYLNDIEDLELLIDRDLSGWK